MKLTDWQLEDLCLRMKGSTLRVDTENCVEVPLDYITDTIAALEELRLIRASKTNYEPQDPSRASDVYY